jgi:selenide,water dikinase
MILMVTIRFTKTGGTVPLNHKKLLSCGGCVAKLSQGLLQRAVASIPTAPDEDLLVGFETSDDGAVYRLRDDLAVIQTLDFFPPVVSDPYLFGQIAAANALSDVFAMGGDVKAALNIVCFPEEEDPAILAAILQGGGEKVIEAGGVLCGGHSISDREIKYGLSVTGTVHPDRILRNNTCEVGDRIILTKPLGVGMIAAAYTAGEASLEGFQQAINSMTTLNRYAVKIARRFGVRACTDVTGFGFLGHLNEMVTERHMIAADSRAIPFIPEAHRLAEDFLITAGGQRNRDFLQDQVLFEGVPEPMREILFDPQTSGGLLLCVPPDQAAGLLRELNGLEQPSAVVAEVRDRSKSRVVVY